jgi:CRISPR/Cas system-associated endonuclease Cas1
MKDSVSKTEPSNADVIAIIENRLESLGTFKEYVLEREKLAVDTEARSFSLPSADATDKLLRYEAHFDRQFYRAMDELERLQRRRKGENIPPLNFNLGRR